MACSFPKVTEGCTNHTASCTLSPIYWHRKKLAAIFTAPGGVEVHTYPRGSSSYLLNHEEKQFPCKETLEEKTVVHHQEIRNTKWETGSRPLGNYPVS